MKNSTAKKISELIERYPALEICRADLILAVEKICQTFRAGNKLLVCGNGGSAATASHYVCDFNKGISEKKEKKFNFVCLNDNYPQMMAIANDISYDEVFRFPLINKLKPTDLVIGISGSGNSKNVMSATVVARALGIKVIGLTGAKGGELATVADVCVKAPSDETYIIQEFHLPIYHCWCLMLEDKFFGNA